MNNALNTAKNCRHYAMCKIDYLGTGICRSGLDKHYVSFFPQGRMDLYAALMEKRIPFTPKCKEIAETCDLCGKCDYQCYFVTELKPSLVMKALKEYSDSYINGGKEVVLPARDEVLEEIRNVTGRFWAENDPAVTLTYSHDPGPLTIRKMPRFVIMPSSAEEVSEVIKILKKQDIPYAVRGNGSSVMGFVMSEGAVIDLKRMNSIEFDEKNYFVKTGPGVSAFELQKEAQKRGYRINAAEPSAMVCANLMCSGIFSTFSASYGTAAENYVDAEFIDAEGGFFSLNDKTAPNLFSFNKEGAGIPGICVSASIKLHNISDDEECVLVPFRNLEDALDFSYNCASRRIGLANGVLGGEYISTFLSPTVKTAQESKKVFTEKLMIRYLVLIIGDKYAINAVREMGFTYIDKNLFRIISLGLPSLASAKWIDLLDELSGDKPFSYLGVPGFTELAETALAPSPEQLLKDADPDLKPLLEKIYSNPEMTDPLWLNMFRIVSSRMGREKHVLAFIIYLPVDKKLICEIESEFRSIADSHGIKNDYGFITPLDNGKRCVFEYDYYVDQNDQAEIQNIQKAAFEAGVMIEKYSASTKTVRWIRYVLGQGFSRMDNLLYK